METQTLNDIMESLRKDKNYEKYIHDLWEEVKINKEDEEVRAWIRNFIY